jgi:hypothetical protein
MIDKREFRIWPDPKEGKSYGPSAKQRLLFIEDLPDEDTWIEDINIKRPHYHSMDVCVYVGGARSGKCFEEGTELITPDGMLIKVENLCVGDKLLGPDLEERMVGQLVTGKEELYTIIQDSGISFGCNGEHILIVKTHKHSLKHKKITVNEYLKLTKKQQDKLFLFKYTGEASRFSIKFKEIGTYYGFGLIGNDELCLLKDGTVVHNTVAAVARILQYLLRYKGSLAVIGASNYPLLQRTALKEIQDRFTNIVPWDFMRDAKPIILKKPSQNDKRIILANGSQALTIHFNNPEVLRGIDADIIMFEEACLLPNRDSFDELCRRLSGRKGPLRQLILTTNPEKTGGWMSKTFKLKQKPDKNGDYPPINDPCKCHFCQNCLNKKKGNFHYLNQTGDISIEKGSKCPTCNESKESNCPGKQVFWRVIRTATMDNQHAPQDLNQTMLQNMDAKSAALYVEGKLDVEFRESYVYRSFTEINNVNEIDIIPDYTKPLFWTLDFNFDPQCSVICQEIEEDGDFHIRVLDEIILWNALPEHAAEEFCLRYEDYKESGLPVYIYGDPSGLYGVGDGLILSYFQKVRDVLVKNGFEVKVMMKKPDPNANTKIKERVKIPVAERIEAVNALLCNAEDPPKIRIKINPKCEHLIMSLAGLQFTEDGKGIDKKVDKNAGRSSNKLEVHLMSHPSDAFGYYIYKRFPVFRNKRGITTFFQVPGEAPLELKNGRFVEKKRTEEEVKLMEERREKRRLRRDERKKRKEERNQGLKSSLNYLGLLNNNFF